MRLHLPKTLLAAVLAACAALPTWGEDSGGAVDTPTTTYTVTVGDTTKTFNDLDIGSTLPTTTKEALWVYTSTGAKVTVTSGTQGQLNNARTIILGDGSYTATTTGEDGNPSTSAPQEVTASQLFLQGWNGDGGSTEKINITSALIVGVNGGDLSSDGAKNAAVRFGADTNASYEVKISGDITVAADATFVAGGNNAVISGSIISNGKTLTLGNFNSAAIYNLTGADEKSISLGGLTISGNTAVRLNYGISTIGTLTLNSSSTSAALTLNGSGTTTITSLVTGGNVLDASGLEGTLTINGAKWTGGLAAESVEVVRAKDNATAVVLAASMDTTHGLSYRFTANGSSVYRTLRTEYYTALTATTDANDSSRIVIGSIAYDGKTFTNVALKDLVAGDTVTINGLTGWIGDSNSNSILANLVFEGENSINNGSSDGTINYSGAISGSGTLSFDWIVTESNGTTTIKTNTYVFTGDLSGFTGTIKDDATLNVTIGGSPTNGTVKATIDIAGNLTVNRETTFTEGFTANQLKGNKKIVFDGAQTINCTQDGDFSGNIDVKSGKLTVKGLVKTTGDFDLCGPSATNRYRGTVEVASQGSLTVGGTIWGLKNSAKILLQENGSLKWNDLVITGKTAIADVETGLTIGETQALNTEQSLNTLRNSTVTYTGTGSKTLSWTLTDTDLVVQSGTLCLGANVNASNVTVSNGSTLELVLGWQQKLSSSNTTWEAGATLRYVSTNAVDLDVGTVSGSTIEMNCVTGTLNAANAESEVVVEGDIKLTGSDTAAAAAFTTIVGKSYTFKGGVAGGGNLNLNQANKTTALIFEGDLSGWTSQSTDWSGLYANAGIINATISGDPAEKAVKNAFNAASGAQLNLTIDRDAVLTNTVNITSLAVNDKKTLSLSEDNNAVAVSSTTVGNKAKLVIGNKGEGTNINLGTVSGSGTISSERTAAQSVTLGTGTDNAFTGTLEAKAGQLNVTAKDVQTLAGLTANGGNVDVMNATLLSVTDMVIGDNATVGVYSVADKTTESSLNIYGSVNSKASLTIGSGATLNANLSVIYAKLKFNGGPLAMGSTLTLFADGTSELLGIDLSTVTATGLTLFTGVDGFSTGWDPASDDAVTIDDAHDIFGNLTAGAYSLRYTGGTDGDVLLIANNPTPEPATATLSLLALMGLAARRRRKA